MYLATWRVWLGVAAVYAGIYYLFAFLGNLTEVFPIITWALIIIQIGVYLYFFIGLSKLSLSLSQPFALSSGSVYARFATLFTPLSRLAEPFFLILGLYALIVLLLQLTLYPETTLVGEWLVLTLRIVGYALVLGVLLGSQFALFANLQANLLITEAYGASIRGFFKTLRATLLLDAVVLAMVFVGYVSQILLFFVVPFGCLVLAIHYTRRVQPLLDVSLST